MLLTRFTSKSWGRLLLEDKELHVRDLKELNEKIAKACSFLNEKPFTNKKVSRAELFEEEKNYLHKPPQKPYAFFDWKKLTVDPGHCIKINPDGHCYSVPIEYIGKEVIVQLSKDEVIILEPNCCRTIAKHQRCSVGQAHKTYILPQRLTESEKYFRADRQQYRERFEKYGLSVTLTDQLLNRFYESSQTKLYIQKQLKAILKLYSRMEIETSLRAFSINLAIEECLKKDMVELRLIRLVACRIARQLRDSKQSSSFNPNYETPKHDNIRKNYYHWYPY